MALVTSQSMKLQKQGPYQCGLATIAMLANVSLADAITIAADVADIPLDQFDWYRYLLGLGKSGSIKYVTKLCAVFNLSSFPIYANYGIVSSSQPMPEPDLSGRGQLTLVFSFWAHAVAYENGLIYDPDIDDDDYVPCSWPDYLTYRTKHNLPIILSFNVHPVYWLTD